MKKSFTYLRTPISKKPISVSLILAQLFIIVSYAFFIHTHILGDGTRIIHAHFFTEQVADNNEADSNSTSNEESKQHEHTSYSYSFFSVFNHFFKNGLAEFSFNQSFQIFTWLAQKPGTPFSSETFSLLRAPPVHSV
ncbi:hypothetical protein BY457_12611 [Marinilabilia salmonicolor]|uniref:hypothetical protein n=1 Tax=Marinilabilia salmonicolor TaxID=989 RepID=UPI000D47A8CF|nr:hypothetical protein [Marinilabilia salmonicolor]PRY91336.1 hypothetical protein BY457_12611 [Marinilabilia salmonicolor]